MTNGPIGSFTFVLHSHIPYARKAGVWPFGEEWIHEALSETYIPILNILYDLVEEGVKPRLTLGITPVLAEQLADKYLMEKFEKYVNLRIEGAEGDIALAKKPKATKDAKEKAKVASFYRDWYTMILDSFKKRYKGDVIGAFRKLQNDDNIEIITSAATHGYLPLIGTDSSINAQIKVGVETYKRHFKRRPRGIWLPECAYRPSYHWKRPTEKRDKGKLRPGIEKFLADNGIEYFFVDTKTIEGGVTVGVYAERFPKLKELWNQFKKEYDEIKPTKERTTYLPYLLRADSGFVSVYGRNEKSGLQVWSGDYGYPGDGWYREFHKKDANSGLQYWRVTGSKVDLGKKAYYDPQMALERTEDNSNHFVGLIKQMLAEFNGNRKEHGIVVAMYDTELFGHWWFEGPEWMKKVLRKLSKDETVELTTGGKFLDAHMPKVIVTLPESSWGQGGHHFIWYNPEVEWMWPKIYQAEDKMRDLADKYAGTKDETTRRVLNQASREMLLLESSDWPFLISTGQAKKYSSDRFEEHVNRFYRCVEMLDRIEDGKLPAKALAALEKLEDADNVFPTIQFEYYKTYEYGPKMQG